jgi:drug/metabolite transporter (DMT)-like permease
MVELISCIIACALLVISFKIFERLKISAFVAIVVNYGVAGSMGFFVEPETTALFTKINEPWFLNGCILGFIFISNFYMMALSAQKIGASVTSVASKMSLVITVMFGVVYLNESINAQKIVGIVLALASVFFITQINTREVNKKYLFLPLLLFFGGGFIDISLNYNQVTYLKDGGSGMFSATTFMSAFVLGLLMLIYQLITKKIRLDFKSMLGGIVLGIINWLSIFLLLLTLKNPAWDSSTVYTLVNIGILLLVVLAGVVIFKEKLNGKQWLGVLLALIAIIIISLA